MSTRKVFCVIFSFWMFLGLCHVAKAKSAPIDAVMSGQQAQEEYDLKEWNNQIRREKFDIVLPEAMRKNNVDMWIHVMRVAIPDRSDVAGELHNVKGESRVSWLKNVEPTTSSATQFL